MWWVRTEDIIKRYLSSYLVHERRPLRVHDECLFKEHHTVIKGVSCSFKSHLHTRIYRRLRSLLVHSEIRLGPMASLDLSMVKTRTRATVMGKGRHNHKACLVFLAVTTFSVHVRLLKVLCVLSGLAWT